MKYRVGQNVVKNTHIGYGHLKKKNNLEKILAMDHFNSTQTIEVEKKMFICVFLG